MGTPRPPECLPEYDLIAYTNGDELPAEAEELFAHQLLGSRRTDDQWRFALTCAVTRQGSVLGGVHLDIGPISGAGPIADKKLAYLERTLVRPECRRQGVATAVLKRAIQVAAEAGCEYIRCHNDWDNPAETALFRKCGFALIDLNGEEVDDPSYFAVRSLQNVQ